MHRRDLLRSGLGASLATLLGTSDPHPAGAANPPPAAAPAPGPFDGNTVHQLAQQLSRQAFKEPESKLPAAVDSLTFDQYRGIRYRADHALWSGQNLPFTVQFFPRGFLYRPRVEMFEVAAGQAQRIAYSPDQFDFADPALRMTDDLGFGGFRIHAPLNKTDYYDEFCAFLGASYFRAVAKGQAYGLSARGLAIGTGNPRGEEFAQFVAFWLERPMPGVNSLIVHALLDSRSVTGSFRFTIRPGDITTFDVESTLYPRVDIAESGIAPLTGMFYFDANDRGDVDDWRPAAHDSEGLSVWNGRGEEVWRPLINPRNLQLSAFSDIHPHGFGLMQRKRAFVDYQDLALNYGQRPSLWIEPVGDWGEGVVDLVEIPTVNEVNDNIVAFWRPKETLSAKGEYHFTYRMHWGWDCPWPSKRARIADTRIGATGDKKGRMIMLDFVGEAAKALTADNHPHAELTTSAGTIQNVVVEPNPDISGWRVIFDFLPGDATVADLHGQLVGDQGPLSETWLYRWTS